MNNVAIILARGGSKGIKNKNIIKINNKPLIYWSIKVCLRAKNIKSVWVSSDSDKILNVAKKLGSNIIKRPKNISGDNSSSEKAWHHSIEYINKNFYNVDTVIGIQPTSPIRAKGVLDQGIRKYYKEKLDSMFTAKEVLHNNIWRKQNGIFKPNYDLKKRPMRQKLEKKYQENGSFYIFDSKKFLKRKKRLFGKIGCLTMKTIPSLEIDNYEDLELFSSLRKFF